MLLPIDAMPYKDGNTSHLLQTEKCVELNLKVDEWCCSHGTICMHALYSFLFIIAVLWLVSFALLY